MSYTKTYNVKNATDQSIKEEILKNAPSPFLEIENIEKKFYQIVNSESWAKLQEKFNMCHDILVLGHGGNMAIADHAAVDISRLSGGTKNAMCPSSGTVITSYINDTNFDQWMVQWLNVVTSGMSKAKKKRTMILGYSSSGMSKDLIKAFQWGYSNGLQLGCITSKELAERIPTLSEVVMECNFYHTAEVLSLFLQYQLTHGAGNHCPPIGGNKPSDLARYDSSFSGKIREHSFPDETKNIGIDFDGVIHGCSKGYHDGTIYDEPIPGSREALHMLAGKYDVVIYTAKAKPDRGLVNGKTGTQLVWEWLKKNDMDKYVTKVTAEKPRAVAYIDDKGFRFTSWNSCIEQLKVEELI